MKVTLEIDLETVGATDEQLRNLAGEIRRQTEICLSEWFAGHAVRVTIIEE